MPVKCSVRLRRSISASRRKASAESPRLPADSRTRAARVQAGIERGSSRDRPIGRANRLGELGVGLQVSGQDAPIARPSRPCRRRALCAIASIRAASRPAAWSFLTRASSTAVFSSSFSASLAAAASCDFGVVIPLEPMRVIGQLEPEAEVVFLERDGLGQRRDGLLDIAEAGQHLGQPGQVLGVLVGPVGDLGPGGPGFVGSLEVMEVLAEILVILGVVGSQLDGFFVEGQGVVDHLGLAQQVGDLGGGHRVVGLGHEQLAPDRRGGRLAVGQGLGGVAQDQGAPVAERVGVVGVGLVEGLVLGGGLGELLVLVELGDQRQPQVAASRGQLDRLFVPGLGLGGAAHGRERAAQSDQGLDVLGLFLGPVFVIGDQAGLVVVAEEDLLDLAADFAMEPAIGPELGEHGLEVVEGLVGLAEPDLQVGGLHGELDLAEGVGGFLGEGLEAGQGLGGLVLLGECRGDLFLDASVVGEEGFEPVPDLEGLVVFLGALIDAAQGLEDFEEVVPRRLAFESAFESGGGLFGLADQDEGLAEVIGGQGIVGSGGLGLSKGGDGGGVLAALAFEEAEDQPAGAVLGVLGEAILIGLDEGVERAAFDVVTVDAVEGRAAARVLFEEREEPLVERSSRASSAATGSGAASAAGGAARLLVAGGW